MGRSVSLFRNFSDRSVADVFEFDIWTSVEFTITSTSINWNGGSEEVARCLTRPA